MMQLATLCYVDSGESYLLLHRHKKENDIHFGKWIGVGGKCEAGETLIECVCREVYEETGLRIYQPQLRGFITFPNFDGIKDWQVAVFVAKHYDGQLVSDSPEGTLSWVPYDALCTKPLWQGDTIFLQWLLRHSPLFMAKMVYDKGILVSHAVHFCDES